MLINYGRKFTKQYDKADSKIKNALKKRLKLFEGDPHNPLLNNHSLTGQYSGYHSINITGDWRAIFEENVDEEGEKHVNFRILGTHSELYK